MKDAFPLNYLAGLYLPTLDAIEVRDEVLKGMPGRAELKKSPAQRISRGDRALFFTQECKGT